MYSQQHKFYLQIENALLKTFKWTVFLLLIGKKNCYSFPVVSILSSIKAYCRQRVFFKIYSQLV